MIRTALGLLVPLAILGAAAPVSAQYVGMGSMATYNNPGSALCDTMIWGKIHQRMLEKRIGARAQGTSTASPAKPSASPPTHKVMTTFRPTESSAAATKLAETVLEDPGDRAKLVQYFQLVWQAYSKQAAEQGYKNDIAHAMAFFIAGNWGVATQKEIAPAALPATARQLRTMMQGMDGLAKATDAQKEAFARGAVMLTALVAAGYDQAAKQGDEKAKDNFVEGARSCLKSLLGLRPEQIQISEKGMVVK